MSQDTSFEMKTSRVLLAGHLPPPMSGIGTFYQTLLDSSLPRRVNLRFIDTSLRRRRGSETGKLSFVNLVSAIGDCVRFTIAVVTHRPDVCHIATSIGLSFLKHSVCVAVAKIFGCKVLLHPHCSFDFLYERQGRVWQWFVRQVIGLCHAVAVLSHEWNGLQKVIPGCQIYYLPNAVDVASYSELGREKLAFNDKKCPLQILYLGHIGRDKGSFDLIRAAKTVLQRERGVIFDLVGHEQVVGDSKQLITEVAEAGFESVIRIHPAVTGDEKVKFLRAADIFVYPSYHEGMPMAVIEAMACGLPIIATQVGGLPDLVHHGINGFLVPAGRPDQLASGIHQLVTDPQMRRSMQTASFRLAHEDFDMENLVVRLLEIYQDLLILPKKLGCAAN